MANYNPTGNPISNTRGTSALIRNEFVLIQAAVNSKCDPALPNTFTAANIFSALQTFNAGITVAGGATITGGLTASGAINFTGSSSFTVPYPTLANQAATKSYVDTVVTTMPAGTLPSVTGQSGKFLTNDGVSSVSWGTVAGGGGQTTTGSLTLTASSNAAITVTPSAPGLYVTLPDATTCSKADNLFSIYNAGDYDYGVKDSAGTQLGWVRARSGAMIGLSDSSTAAGVWAYYGLEKIGVTASYINSTLTGMGNNIRRIALDANRTCFLFGGQDHYAIIYDASTQTWGSPTLVRMSAGAGAFLGVLSATNQVLVVTNDSTTDMRAVTLTISGTTITVNTGTQASVTLGGAIASMGQLIAVGSSWVVSYGVATPQSEARAISVSGTTPTIGAAGTHGATSTAAILFASGSIVRCVSATASSLQCKPYTVSGSTLSAGTNAVVTTTTASIRAFLNGNGNIVCHYLNTTHYATIFKLTGTVEAASSVSLGTAPTSVTATADFVQVTASKTAFVYYPAGSIWYANILTDTAGTASAGTEISGSANGSYSYVAGLATSGNSARFAVGTNTTHAQVTLDGSGSSPVLSAYSQLNAVTSSVGVLAASDAYGVKSYRVLISGQSAYGLAMNANYYDQHLTPNSIGRRIPISITTNAIGVSGASNESIFANSPSAGTVGFAINRIEAAA